MNVTHVLLATLAATVTYFAFGFLVFGVLPILRTEYARYPAVYRTPESMKPVAPIGMLAMLVAILLVVALFARLYPISPTAIAGARFGALVGVFAVCGFVFHNYVNLNIGLKLTLGQAVAYFVEWTLVGLVIGAVYRP